MMRNTKFSSKIKNQFLLKPPAQAIEVTCEQWSTMGVYHLARRGTTGTEKGISARLKGAIFLGQVLTFGTTIRKRADSPGACFAGESRRKWQGAKEQPDTDLVVLALWLCGCESGHESVPQNRSLRRDDGGRREGNAQDPWDLGQVRGENERQSENFWGGGLGGGGLRQFPFSSPSSGLPETQKRPSVATTLFFSAACLLACKTTNQ